MKIKLEVFKLDLRIYLIIKPMNKNSFNIIDNKQSRKLKLRRISRNEWVLTTQSNLLTLKAFLKDIEKLYGCK